MLASYTYEAPATLEALNLYDTAQQTILCWRLRSKTLDNWQLVVHGPATARWWQMHGVASPRQQALCFGLPAVPGRRKIGSMRARSRLPGA